MRKIIAAAVLVSLASPLAAGKKGGTPPDQQVAYRLLGSKASKLIMANEDGTNATSVYSSTTAFRFDLGPRDGGKIAIADAGGSNPAKLYLVSTSLSGSGTLVGSTPVTLTDVRRGSNIDFSPDGSKIAYVCCSDGTNETLAVYDIASGAVTHWATAPFIWDLGWFRNGASLVYSTYGPSEVHEVSAPMAAPQLLFRARPDGGGEIVIDAVHDNPDALLLSYNDTAGNARIGIWQATTGTFVDSDLANSTVSFYGNLNCTDDKLAYLGSPNSSGIQVWYIRDLNTGLSSTFRRDSNIMLQYWPTC